MDNEQPTTLPTEAPAPQTDTPPAEAQVPAAEAPDWQKVLNDAPVDVLEKHSRFQGMLGSRIDQALKRRESELADKARRDAEAEQDDELSRLLDENDQTLAERYPKARERLQGIRQQRAQADLQRQIGESKATFAERIGRAYTSLPEWSEMTPQDMDTLKTALAGKADDDAVEAFAVTAAALVAEKRAEKKAQARFQAELEKARVAIRQEEAAKLLASGAAPDTRRGSSAPGSKAAAIKNMSDSDFEKLWNTEIAGN